jgi:hypothetical protein
MSQAAVASRAHVSQASVARLEAGVPDISVAIIGSVFAALGMDLSLKAYPAAGVPLRDSGQIALTHVIRSAASEVWQLILEAPVGDAHGQAADMLMVGRGFGLHVEIESSLLDFQAQLRRAQLKRDGLQQRHGIKLALILALGESKRNRAAVRAAEAVVRAALPAGAREVLTAVRHCQPLDRDGLLWVRPPPRTNARRLATRSGPASFSR